MNIVDAVERLLGFEAWVAQGWKCMSLLLYFTMRLGQAVRNSSKSLDDKMTTCASFLLAVHDHVELEEEIQKFIERDWVCVWYVIDWVGMICDLVCNRLGRYDM